MDRERTFMKVVYQDDVPHLPARTKKDIEKTDLGRVTYERPLVFFENVQESVEASLWLYAQNILPLITDENMDITCMAAIRYGIDAIIGDFRSLREIADVIPRYPGLAKVAHLVVIGSCAELNSLEYLARAFPAARLQVISV